MARSKKSFDRVLRMYKFKDLAFRMTKVPVLNALGRRVIPPESTTLSYIPVYENLELPGGTVAPSASSSTSYARRATTSSSPGAPAGVKTAVRISIGASAAPSWGPRCARSIPS